MSSAHTSVLVFDVNQTLSDMSPLRDRFADVGAPREAAQTWFAVLLRDGFGLTAAGATARFSTLATGALHTVLAQHRLDRPLADAVDHVQAGMETLPVHPDVPAGLRALSRPGRQLVTLSNGPASTAEQLLGRAGLADLVSRFLSVDDAGAWKPARAAYTYAARACETSTDRMVLAATHPWDIDGANRAGLHTVWISRGATSYPAYFTPPELTVATLTDLAAEI